MQEKYENLTIVVASGDKKVLQNMREILVKSEARVITATRAEHVLNCLENEAVSVTILDQELSDQDGLSLIHVIRERFPEVGVIFTSPTDRSETYSKAFSKGAFDVVVRPFTPDKILSVLERFHEKLVLIKENQELHKQLNDRYGLGNLIGNSLAMQTVVQKVHQFANARSTILLQGETGTGKELIARAIHRLSKRKNKAFVVVNSSTLPVDTAEVDLFGQEEGTMQGDGRRRTGKLDAADGGTLFIDEIADLPLVVQVKLLRFLETQSFQRAGGAQDISVDVRLLAATTANLEKLVEQGKFREDLYYRLKVLSVGLPPLRERRDDVPLLARHFVAEAARRNERSFVPELSSEVYQALIAYDWPGNVRELRNQVEGLVVMTNRPTIELADLPVSLQQVGPDSKEVLKFHLGTKLEVIEREIIIATLNKYDANRRKAAKVLGIGLRTLFRKINKYRDDGFDVP